MISRPHVLASVLCALLTVAATVVLRAQPGPADPIPRTFRIMSYVGSYEELFYQTSAAKSSIRPITISRTFSPPLPAPTGTTLEVFRWIPPPPNSPPGTQPTRQVALTATLDPNAPESLVIGRPLTPENKKTNFQAQAIPLGDDYHAGTCLLANLSGFPSAAISLRDSVHTLKDGATELAAFGKGHTLIKVAVTVQHGGGWALAGDDAWRLNAMYRGYIIVLPYMDDPDYPRPSIPRRRSSASIFRSPRKSSAREPAPPADRRPSQTGGRPP